MNCHDFEAIACDVVRDHLMDVAQREKALAHSASCSRCKSRLADERMLTDGFRFVAATVDAQAPPRVEAALVAAFRQQRAALPAVAPARIAARRWLYAAAAAAAVVVIVALLALISSRTQQSPPPGEQKAEKNTPGASREVAPQPPPAGPERKVAAAQTRERHRPVNRVRNAGRSNRTADDPSAATVEIATDFIPLMNRESLAQMDGGQVMRVELPRSALMSFGLPMDMERAAERIKADVVVGNDGLARAIRFVR